jgi:hypothetical protein
MGGRGLCAGEGYPRSEHQESKLAAPAKDAPRAG